jgi:hypothetical protein
MLAVDFENFTYATNPCYHNVPVPAIVRSGRFDYFDKRMGQGFDIYVESVTEGSLADGTRQAVVVLTCEFPVGGTAAAYVFNEHGERAALLAQVATANWGPDWGAGPDSIRVRFVHDTLHVEQCKDPQCTTTTQTTYTLVRGKLVNGGDDQRQRHPRGAGHKLVDD